MNSTSSIVNHIQKFTSQRDHELIAFSLMQSVKDMLSPKSQSIITVSKYNKVINQCVLREGSGVYLDSNFELDNAFIDCIEYMESQNLNEYIHKSDDGFTLYFLINALRTESEYFVVTTDSKLSNVHLYLLSGMFKIFKNYSDLLNDSQTDQLTGLLNRKTFESSINRYWGANIASTYEGQEKRTQFEEECSWVAILDLDHFKLINDNFGHLFGDEVLILVSNILKRSFRSDDLLFRFGGEEFVVLMRNITKADCIRKLEQVRIKIQEYAFPKIDELTISIGACQFHGDLFYMTILDYADKALYESKKTGRNKITFYDVKAEIDSSINIESEIDLF